MQTMTQQTVMSVMLYGLGKQAWLPGWTEQIWQSSLWRVELINFLQHIAR